MKILFLWLGIVISTQFYWAQCNINLIRTTLTNAGCIELPSCQSQCSMYFYNPQSLSGPDAQTFAENFGANLISIQSSNENTCIINALNSNNFSGVIWLGFTDIINEGNFIWTDQSPVSYSNWAPGEPNNSGGNEDCTQIYPDGLWNDLNCYNYSSKSIIEINLCPQITTSSNVSICKGTSTILTCSNAILGSSPFVYTWSNGMTGQSITVSPETTTNYTVTATDRFGCYIAKTITVTVTSTSFTLGADQSICPGAFTATFTSSNTNAGNTYQWSSGETTSSITKNTTGEYRLTLTDANGCIAKDTVNLVVEVLPTVSYTANSECIYNEVSFNNTTSGAQSLLWDFGDGNTSNGLTPNHQYTSSGNYSTKLVAIFGQGCKDSTTVPISIFDAPQADFTGTNDCFNKTALFANTSIINSGVITNNIWDFGDGNTGNQINESHNYTNPGSYTVTLITVSDHLCYDTISYTFDRHEIPSMSYSFNNSCLYDSILFTNNSTVNSPSVFQSYYWDFGDGNTSNTSTPYHSYSNYGSYTTKLIGTTQFGCQDSLSQDISIYPVPSADYTFTNDCYNVLANFTDQSTLANGTITNWLWSFGDGATGNLNNESHLYNGDGDFQVELVVTSDNNCADTISHTITRHPLPHPSYTANPECIYENILFNDNSTINAPDNITNWEWSFGPGLNSTQQSPSVLFPSAGSNPVKLVLTSNNGCKDSISSTIDVYAKPNASFTSNDDCNNIPATFIDNSSVADGNLISWEWDLGDGNNSTNQNLTHQYINPNTYAIELIVTSNHQCKDTAIQDLVRYPIPTSNFNFTNDCQYNTLTFDNQSTITNSNSIIDYSWNFGDGSNLDQNENTTHDFTTSGLYQVQLRVTSNNNCIDDTIMFVEVYAVPQVNFILEDQCVNVGESHFTNNSLISSGSISQWEWNFGDGFNNNLLHTAHQYANSGTYNVELIGISNNGCSDTIVKPLSIFDKPTADFFINKTEDCVPVCFYFADVSTDANGINFWEWDFDELEGSIVQHPSVCTDEAGVFDVSLIVTNIYNCKDTLIETDLLKARPNPIADFTLSTQETDVLHPFISFTNNSFDALIWKWNLGDGTEDTINFNTENTYNNAGVYSIQLNVENQYGCKDSLAQELIVHPKAFHYLPNSFTPNGDGINDVFKIYSEDFNFQSLSVYDRWGKRIFYSEDIFKAWDGTQNGTEVKVDTYIWLLKYIDKQENNQVEKGSVTLVK